MHPWRPAGRHRRRRHRERRRGPRQAAAPCRRGSFREPGRPAAAGRRCGPRRAKPEPVARAQSWVGAAAARGQELLRQDLLLRGPNRAAPHVGHPAQLPHGRLRRGPGEPRARGPQERPTKTAPRASPRALLLQYLRLRGTGEAALRPGSRGWRLPVLVRRGPDGAAPRARPQALLLLALHHRGPGETRPRARDPQEQLPQDGPGEPVLRARDPKALLLQDLFLVPWSSSLVAWSSSCGGAAVATST